MTERVILDTNVLVAVYDSGRSGHLQARTMIESDPRALAVTAQCLREFLVVLTRPLEQNGYGTSGAQAAAIWREHTSTLEFLPEGVDASRTLQGFVASELASGKQVHDANLVAVALDHGATTLVTTNPRHFERFSHLITIETLS